MSQKPQTKQSTLDEVTVNLGMPIIGCRPKQVISACMNLLQTWGHVLITDNMSFMTNMILLPTTISISECANTEMQIHPSLPSLILVLVCLKLHILTLITYRSTSSQIHNIRCKHLVNRLRWNYWNILFYSILTWVTWVRVFICT